MARESLLQLALCVAMPGAVLAADDWPIKPAAESALARSALARSAPAETLADPGMSQPLGFDPAHYKNAKNIPKDTNIQTVTGVWKEDKPFSLTEYYFDTDDDPSFVLELRQGGKRHALYTEVNQYKYSTDHRTLVLENYLKGASGWQEVNRIIDVASKASAALPRYDCTRFYASVSDAHVVTYGSGTKKSEFESGPPRTVCIWDLHGKLMSALEAPVQNTAANTEESPNSMGLLPGEETTFYMLSYKDKNCVLRLQDLLQPAEHRTILLPAGVFPSDDRESLAGGDIGDPCWEGSAVEMDLGQLRLKGGELRFRVAKTGRADVDDKWLDWVTYK